VLSQGRIVEQGTHDELFSRGGEYQKLYAYYFQDTMNKPLPQEAGGTVT